MKASLPCLWVGRGDLDELAGDDKINYSRIGVLVTKIPKLFQGILLITVLAMYAGILMSVLVANIVGSKTFLGHGPL